MLNGTILYILLAILLLVGIVVGSPLIISFCTFCLPRRRKENKDNFWEPLDAHEEDAEKEEGVREEKDNNNDDDDVEVVEGTVDVIYKSFTQQEYEDIIRITKGEDGKISSELITMINDLPMGELSPCSFTKLSIFDDEDRGNIREDLQKIKDHFENGKKVEFTDKEKRAMGSMLGMAIADAMGHRFEFNPVFYGRDEHYLEGMGSGRGGTFKLEPGQWTDDTSMGLCLADSLIACGGEWDPHDCMHRFLSWWHGGYDNAFRYNKQPRSSCGLGGNISMSMKRYLVYQEDYTKAGDKNVSGNGSIMRACPVPILFHDDEEKAMEISAKQSLVTHQGEEAAECCRLMAHIIVRGINGESLRDVLDNLGNTFVTPVESVQKLARSEQEGENPDRDWRWKINKQYKFSPARTKSNPGYIGSYAMDAMAMALNVLWNTNSFKDAIIKIVNLRGDSDSTGAVLGQIAGAFYGLDEIPKEWVKTVAKWDHYTIPLRGYMLVNKHLL